MVASFLVLVSALLFYYFFPSLRLRARLIVLSLTGQPRTTFLHNHQFSFYPMLVLYNLGPELTDTIAAHWPLMDLFPRGWRIIILHVMYFTWLFLFFSSFWFFDKGKKALNSYDTYHYSTSFFLIAISFSFILGVF